MLVHKISPLVASVAESIRKEIRQGGLVQGRPLEAERALAARFGVSRGVTRQAVDVLVREGWVVAQPRCRPIVAGRPKAADRTKADHINVWLWPSTSDYVASAVFRGIQDGLQGSDYRLVVGTPRRDDDWDGALSDEVRFLDSLSQDDACAGALVWPLGEQEIMAPLAKCREARLPVVFIDREPPMGWVGDVVSTDNVGAAAEVAEFLKRLGHRHTAILSNRDSASSVRDRVEGFRRATGDGHVPVAVFSPQEGESDADAYRRALAPVFAEATRPTALFCINDSLALGALDALTRLGIVTPGDVSVVGFDGLLRWLPGGGHLTSAHQNFRRMGELAAQLLLRRIAERGDPDLPRRYVLLEAPLVVRETTAPPKADRTASPCGRQGDAQTQ
ncbi:MAG: GntR family transcriptional regulator [Fimbriimonadaceae bacterium]|nr:GntR family transcriptional regulator [Fimbriimonadaceae bacterium]